MVLKKGSSEYENMEEINKNLEKNCMEQDLTVV